MRLRATSLKHLENYWRISREIADTTDLKIAFYQMIKKVEDLQKKYGYYARIEDCDIDKDLLKELKRYPLFE